VSNEKVYYHIILKIFIKAVCQVQLFLFYLVEAKLSLLDSLFHKRYIIASHNGWYYGNSFVCIQVSLIYLFRILIIDTQIGTIRVRLYLIGKSISKKFCFVVWFFRNKKLLHKIMKGPYITIIGRSSVRNKPISCLIFFRYYFFQLE